MIRSVYNGYIIQRLYVNHSNCKSPVLILAAFLSPSRLIIYYKSHNHIDFIQLKSCFCNTDLSQSSATPFSSIPLLLIIINELNTLQTVFDPCTCEQYDERNYKNLSHQIKTINDIIIWRGTERIRTR